MNKKVIIAANNMIFTSKMMSILDNLDAEGIKAIRSDEIFTKAQELKPDLIVIDLNLNGIEATCSIPIVCYSPHVLKDQMKAAKTAGATEVFPNSKMNSKMGQIIGKYVES
jgi:DNA-binding NarL/FixJ family response regulator